MRIDRIQKGLRSMATINQQHNTLMVMAGGTGGHVYPAIAVADYLQAQGWQSGLVGRLKAWHGKPFNC